MFDTVILDKPMSLLSDGVEALAGEDRSSWFGTTLSERMAQVISIRERLDAEIIRLTADWDRSRVWEADGALSPAAWMTHRLPVARTTAQSTVRTARFVDKSERTAKALASGDISSGHVRALARVVTDERSGLFDGQEDVLVDAAMTLGVDDFTKVARRWGSLADDQLAAGDFMEQHRHRRLSIATTFGGAVHIEGLLDPEGGAIVIAAIDKLSPPDSADSAGGSRTAPQRRADALVQMGRMVLGGGSIGAPATNLNVLVDGETLAGRTSAAPIADRRCDIDWTGPIGRETLLRMGCDCSVSRIVMKGRSEVLDMGRKTRLVTKVQRRALSTRDGGCVFPSCDRPDSWCDAHHVIQWARGGWTDTDNLALLCRRHHVMCHEGGWMLERIEGGGFRARAPDR